MRRTIFFILLSSLLLSACGKAPTLADNVSTLTVTDGIAIKIYTSTDLQKLGQVQLVDKGVTYMGIPLIVLLQNSGYDPTMVTSVQAIASDKFTASYDQVLLQKPDSLLAYSLLDGPMSEYDGAFRMVLPGQPGKLNPRMVVELLVGRP